MIRQLIIIKKGKSALFIVNRKWIQTKIQTWIERKWNGSRQENETDGNEQDTERRQGIRQDSKMSDNAMKLEEQKSTSHLKKLQSGS